MPFAATWMELEIIILSEVNQTEEDKYHMILLLYTIFKNDTNELIYKIEKDSIQKMNLCLRGGKGRERDKVEVWD